MWSTTLTLLLLLLGSSAANFFDGVPGPMDVAQKFVDRIERSVRSRDVAVIRGLFHPDFQFKGCKGTYRKEKVVSALTKIPAGIQFSYTAQSAETHGNDQIKFVVTVTGFDGVASKQELILNIHDQQLQSGRVLECPSTRGFSAHLDDPLPPKVQIERFLAEMVEFIDAKNPAVLEDLFLSHFIFKGCRALYNRKETIDMLMMIPEGSRFSINVTNVRDVGASIRAQVLVTGLMQVNSPFGLVFNKAEQKLENAEFLYSQTLNEIKQIPNDANIDFKLKSSKWNENGQIDFTVTFYGELLDGVDVQFVYSPDQNVLKSGSVPSCLARKVRRAAPCIGIFKVFC
ncbi:hypothetical protein CAEBREN_22832 [Caenorhabditis brenneri]|uniref:NTF2-like domain-containing protein n=1 Tax=Caenorhabditis brenneri TaxID=135651 RepID=G0MNZ0_CAEBE|nr:hypothetical protein CAEBREN_22832 [Caenorhabditis brenneri]